MSKNLILKQLDSNGVLTITLNDPDSLNAMGEDMGREFEEVVRQYKSQKELRLVVIKGAGRAFSAGGNLEMLKEKTKISRDENKKRMLEFYNYFLSVLEFPVPVLAAINGHAVGAGLCLALACDLRIIKSQAKVGVNFVKLGLHPGMAATYFLPKIVGLNAASDLLYTGKISKAEELGSLNLFNKIVKEEDFEDTVSDYVSSIVSGGPESMRQLKESLRVSLSNNLEECLEREASAQAANYSSKEFLEGITAAKEKRKPNF